ncbi:MAG: DUF362 domain-containing protein [Propionibacteriaceae bacterium]|nr:DUF362 domain-containing protein [Propionibacteriaceae bacterium]
MTETPSSASTVYFTKAITPAGLRAAYDALKWTPTGKVAVKLSTGEEGNPNYLQPALIKDLVHHVDGTIVECNTAYGGARSTTESHYKVAADHGFTEIADVDIMDADGQVELPVPNGSVLSVDRVGSHALNYDSYLVLTHFKGHPMGGFGGALKNISIGMASAEGKMWQHSGGKNNESWDGDDDFRRAMAEAASAVAAHWGDRMVYVSVMNNMSVDCDCAGEPAPVDMADIGILASTDPVALDQACIDLVWAADDNASMKERVESRHGLITIDHAAEIGVGSKEYTLVNLD